MPQVKDVYQKILEDVALSDVEKAEVRAIFDAQSNVAEDQTLNYMNTGIRFGGDVTINVDTTKIDITAGKAVIINNTDRDAPTFTPVTWAAFTAEALPDVVGDIFTSVAINAAGTALVFKQNAEFTHTERLANVILSNIVHPALVITSTASRQVPAYNLLEQFYDLARIIGPINLEDGSVISSNGANLMLNRGAGDTFSVSSNYQVDPLDPHVISSLLETGISFGHSYRDGVGGTTFTGSTVTNVDPTKWDDGSGVLATVTNNNTWTLQPLWWFPSSKNHVMQYGQTEYANLAAAVADIPPNTFSHPEILHNGGTLRAWIAMKKNTTDLSNITENAIIQAGRFNP